MGALLYGKLLGFRKQLIGNLAMIALPLVFIFLFGGMSVASGNTLPFANLDQSPMAQRLVEEMEAGGLYKMVETGREELEEMVRENQASLGLIIPEGFGESMDHPRESEIIILKSTEDPEYFALQSALYGAVQNISMEKAMIHGQMEILKDLDIDEGMAEQRLGILIRENLKGTSPLAIQSEVYQEQDHLEINQVTHTSFGFLLFFSMFPIIFIIGDILEDKRHGIWDRLIISPISKLTIYMTNLMYTFVIGMIQVGVLVLLTHLFFEVEWLNNILGVLLILAGFVFAVTALGLLISTLVKNHQQLNSVVPIITVSTSMLGGAFWPIEIISSKVLLILAKMTPQYWAMEALKKVVVLQQGTDQILLSLAVFVLMGVLYIGIGVGLKEK